MSRLSDIETVKLIMRYEPIARVKMNFDKSEGLRLGAWSGGPFCWSDGPICILGVWFGPGLQLKQNISEVLAKVKAQVVTWLRNRLSSNVQDGGVRRVHFPLDHLPVICTFSA